MFKLSIRLTEELAHPQPLSSKILLPYLSLSFRIFRRLSESDLQSGRRQAVESTGETIGRHAACSRENGQPPTKLDWLGLAESSSRERVTGCVAYKYHKGERRIHRSIIMGKKRGGKNNVFKKDAAELGVDTRKKFKGEEAISEWEYEHPVFEAYYRLQFTETYFKEDASEFDVFWNKLKEKLPVVFRVNKLVPNYESFMKQFSDNPTILQDFAAKKKVKLLEEAAAAMEAATETAAIQTEEELQKQIAADEKKKLYKVVRFEFSEEELAGLKITPVSFYPDNLVWQINCNRTEIKKSKLLKDFHWFLQRATDSGIISRQELVSMLPPLFLDVAADDTVFDMCAAPGSKTAQLLELMAGKGGLKSQGVVVANDVDQQRAYLLTHQVCRINPSGLVVINHPAQFFPKLPDTTNSEGKFFFDKVQADVPCSGDGATRKIPALWQSWNARDGQILHPLQLAILQRALSLCKVGGYVVYSTCSINPIEDEAVITEAFRRASPNSIELEDLHGKLPALKGRRGLASWKVCSCLKKKTAAASINTTDALRTYEAFSDVNVANDINAKFIRASMFPDTEAVMTEQIKIHRTMRILPHDQNTGGFYLALIKKTAPILWAQKQQQPGTSVDDDLPDASEIPQEAEKLLNMEVNGEGEEGQAQQQPSKQDGEGEVLRDSFAMISDEEWANVQDSYGFESLTQKRFVSNVVGKQKIVRFITEGAARFNECYVQGASHMVNMGTKAFERQGKCGTSHFRICQDSVNLLGPFMTKRKLLIEVEDFKHFVVNRNLKYEEIPNKSLGEAVKSLGFGTVVLFCEAFNDYLICQNFSVSVNIMISREAIDSFKIRYIESSPETIVSAV